MTKLACLETIKRRRKGLSPLTIVKRPPSLTIVKRPPKKDLLFMFEDDFYNEKLISDNKNTYLLFWLFYFFLLGLVIKYF